MKTSTDRYKALGKRLGGIKVVDGKVAWQRSAAYTLLPLCTSTDLAERAKHKYLTLKHIGGQEVTIPERMLIFADWHFDAPWSEKGMHLGRA